MGIFICRQPNGLLCRFSMVVDTITDYNMTEEEYIEKFAEDARETARDIIKYHLAPYERIDEYFAPNNMTVEEFEKIKAEMAAEITPADKTEKEEYEIVDLGNGLYEKRKKQYIKIDVAKRIWKIAGLSPEHGNAVMDILGEEAYQKVMHLQKEE